MRVSSRPPSLIQQSEGAAHLIESRLGELEAQEQHLRGSLEQRHGSISALLAAMQRMGRNPPPVMVTRARMRSTMVRSAMLLAAAFPELRSQAIALAEQLNDLVRVMTSIRTEGEKLRAETTRLNDARTRLAGAAGGEAPVALRAAGGAGAGSPGRSRHIKERRRPQRPDLASSTRRLQSEPGSAPTRRRLRPLRPHRRLRPRSSRPRAPSRQRPPRQPRALRHRRQPGRGARCLDRAGPERRRPRGDADAGPHQAARSPFSEARGILPMPANGQARPEFWREDPVWQPIQGPRARNPARRPGRVPVRWLDRVRGRVPQLRPALDHQCGRRVSYSTCWTISDRCAAGPIRAGRRAGRRDERCWEHNTGQGAGQCPGPLHRIPQGPAAHRSRPLVGRMPRERCKDDAQIGLRILDFRDAGLPRRCHDRS